MNNSFRTNRRPIDSPSLPEAACSFCARFPLWAPRRRCSSTDSGWPPPGVDWCSPFRFTNTILSSHNLIRKLYQLAHIKSPDTFSHRMFGKKFEFIRFFDQPFVGGKHGLVGNVSKRDSEHDDDPRTKRTTAVSGEQ